MEKGPREALCGDGDVLGLDCGSHTGGFLFIKYIHLLKITTFNFKYISVKLIKKTKIPLFTP